MLTTLIALTGLTWDRALLALAGGFGAAMLNNLTAGGALISYTLLLSAGYSPVLASVTNTVGLTAGSVSGAIGYQRELRGRTGDGQPPVCYNEALFHGLTAWIGGCAGAWLLMSLPAGAFSRVLPWLLGGVTALIIANVNRKRIRALLTNLRIRQPPPSPATDRRGRRGRRGRRQLWAWPAILLGGIYGGFFAAGQGLIFVAALGIVRNWTMQRIVAYKQILTSAVNGAATAMFAVLYHPEWRVAVLMAIGSFPGGWAGARLSSRLPDVVLQAIILAAAAYGIYHAIG